MDKDSGKIEERAGVSVEVEGHEPVTWRARARLEKYAEGVDPAEGKPYEVLEMEGNLLMTAGVLRIWQKLRGDAGNAFNNTNSRLGVGDSATAEAAGQTDLQAATNKLRKGMETGWPKVGTADGLAGDDDMEFKSSFGTAEANFVWAEWGIFDSASAGLMLNRKVQALGTKATGTWVLTVTISLA
jgi:hypothetical protein